MTVNTTPAYLRCLTCGAIFAGDVGAMAHAEVQPDHDTRFSPYYYRTGKREGTGTKITRWGYEINWRW